MTETNSQEVSNQETGTTSPVVQTEKLAALGKALETQASQGAQQSSPTKVEDIELIIQTTEPQTSATQESAAAAASQAETVTPAEE